jgi:hypothetical protein
MEAALRHGALSAGAERSELPAQEAHYVRRLLRPLQVERAEAA